MVVWRKGAAHDRAGGREMDRKAVGDGRVVDVGHPIRRKERSDNMAVLSGLARGKRRERSDGQTEVESDAVEVARANAGARQNEQTMLGQELAELVHKRKDRSRAAIHDGAAADLDDL